MVSLGGPSNFDSPRRSGDSIPMIDEVRRDARKIFIGALLLVGADGRVNYTPPRQLDLSTSSVRPIFDSEPAQHRDGTFVVYITLSPASTHSDDRYFVDTFPELAARPRLIPNDTSLIRSFNVHTRIALVGLRPDVQYKSDIFPETGEFVDKGPPQPNSEPDSMPGDDIDEFSIVYPWENSASADELGRELAQASFNSRNWK